MNFYQLLGVARNATPDEIAKAYRKKAASLHPDLNPSPQAAEDFKKLNEAYQTLLDPSKRAIYNSKNPEVVPGRTGRPPKKEPVNRNDPNFGKSTIIDVPQAENVDIWSDIRKEIDSWEQRKEAKSNNVWEDWEWKADAQKAKPKYNNIWENWEWKADAQKAKPKYKDPNLGKHTIIDVPEKKSDLNAKKENHFKDSVRYEDHYDLPDLR